MRNHGAQVEVATFRSDHAYVDGRHPSAVDFETDPPPDIAVEIDIHHDSVSKFPIYVGLGVPEIWRYDEEQVTIYHLEHDDYVQQAASLALPMLTDEVLTEFLARLPKEGDLQAILAFDKWLQAQQQ